MNQLKILNPFGPKIARLKFPELIIKKINLEVEIIIKQKKPTTGVDHVKLYGTKEKLVALFKKLLI
jgi:hypothetical protein